MNISIDKLDLRKLDKKLEHLTEEEITEVITAYYSGEKIPHILSKYNIKATPSSLVRIFPPVITELLCNKCNDRMLTSLPSRSSSIDTNRQLMYCSGCGHQENSYCTCPHCTQAAMERKKQEEMRKKIELEKKQKFIAEFFSEEKWDSIEEDVLTLEDKVYLAVLMRAALSEDTKTIEPLEPFNGAIAPTSDLEKEVIRTLTGKNVLLPSSKSSIHAFEVDMISEEDEPINVTYYTYKARYRINVEPQDGDYDAMIKRLMYPDISSEEGFQSFCYELWKRIALSECLEYLLFQMNKVGYSFSPGEKTIKVFEELLEHFSVSQIYSVIYRAVANSTQRYQAREITKIHAQNSVISSCESYGQRAIAQGWKLTHYSRLKTLPETFISKVFFTSIMQISDLGFSETPTPKF